MKNNYHVHFRSDGTVIVLDSNKHITHHPSEEDLPMWMQEGLALLRMVRVGDNVDGVGVAVGVGGLAWSEGFYLYPPEENEV